MFSQAFLKIQKHPETEAKKSEDFYGLLILAGLGNASKTRRSIEANEWSALADNVRLPVDRLSYFSVSQIGNY